MKKLLDLICRKCGKKNPMVFVAPIKTDASCICSMCARVRGWLDTDGSLEKGIEL